MDNINLDHVRQCSYWPGTSNRFEVRRLSIETTKEDATKYPLSRRESDLSSWNCKAIEYLIPKDSTKIQSNKIETVSSDYEHEVHLNTDRIDNEIENSNLNNNKPISNSSTVRLTNNTLRAHNLPDYSERTMNNSTSHRTRDCTKQFCRQFSKDYSVDSTHLNETNLNTNFFTSNSLINLIDDGQLIMKNNKQRLINSFEDKRNSRSSLDLNPIDSNCLLQSCSSCNSLGVKEKAYLK